MASVRTRTSLTTTGLQSGSLYPAVNHPPPANPLFNRPAYSSTVYNEVFDTQGSMKMSTELAEAWGKSRLYRSPWLNNPTYGKQFSAANPPAVPKMGPAADNMALADVPFGHPVADQVYRDKLFVESHIQSSPYATTAQLYGPTYVNTMVA